MDVLRHMWSRPLPTYLCNLLVRYLCWVDIIYSLSGAVHVSNVFFFSIFFFLGGGGGGWFFFSLLFFFFRAF